MRGMLPAVFAERDAQAKRRPSSMATAQIEILTGILVDSDELTKGVARAFGAGGGSQRALHGIRWDVVRCREPSARRGAQGSQPSHRGNPDQQPPGPRLPLPQQPPMDDGIYEQGLHRIDGPSAGGLDQQRA